MFRYGRSPPHYKDMGSPVIPHNGKGLALNHILNRLPNLTWLPTSKRVGASDKSSLHQWFRMSAGQSLLLRKPVDVVKELVKGQGKRTFTVPVHNQRVTLFQCALLRWQSLSRPSPNRRSIPAAPPRDGIMVGHDRDRYNHFPPIHSAHGLATGHLEGKQFTVLLNDGELTATALQTKPDAALNLKLWIEHPELLLPSNCRQIAANRRRTILSVIVRTM